jgi:geranylgeranyl pyrophosphate synthase
MNAVFDELLIQHLNFEKEQVHLLTILYGVFASKENPSVHLKIAKSFELMKSATLILDDFLDKSSYRNGIPSFYSKYGGEQASLVSEVLKSTATIAFSEGLAGIPNLSSENRHQCLLIFEDTYRTVCLGQLEDIKYFNFNKRSDAKFTEKDYLRLIEKTTAVFIRLPLLISSILNNHDSSTCNALSNFGLYIGLAYQIRDDVIDLIGNPELTGKPVGGDIKEGKVRLPIIYLFHNGSPQELEKIKDSLSNPEISQNEINEAIQILHSCGAIDYCNKKVKWFCKNAINQLNEIKNQTVKQQFEDIAEYLLPTEECS